MNISILVRQFIFFPWFLCFLSLPTRGQILAEKPGADSLSSTLVPVVAYSSDEGIIGGLMYDRKNYRGDIDPFKNRIRSKVLASTRGFIEVEGSYEETRSWGSDIRSVIDLRFHRYTADTYFGIGNTTPYSEADWDNDYYYFKSLGWELSYKGYKPIYERGKSQLAWQFGAGIEYESSQTKNDSTSFALYPPNGIEGGWTNYLSTGFVFENRDRTFDVRRGNRTEITFTYAPHLIGDYGLVTAHGQFQQYFQPFNFLTIANMVNLRYVGGDVPYWKMSTLGDDYTLRGYPLNRYQGNASVAYTLELRSWIFKFPQFYNLKLGGHLFTDTGRVFTDEDDINDVFNGYHQTVGIGGTISVLKPDFIMRGEIGFSKDASRIYIGLGYLF